MTEAVYRGYRITSYASSKEKWKVILKNGCMVEHHEIRNNSAVPNEEVAFMRGLLLVDGYADAQDAMLEQLSKEAPVELPTEDVPSVPITKRWVMPDRGLEGHDC